MVFSGVKNETITKYKGVASFTSPTPRTRAERPSSSRSGRIPAKDSARSFKARSPRSDPQPERPLAMSNDREPQTTPLPGSLTYKTVLGQDFVTSDGVLIDTQLAGQVGSFRNPHKLNAVEALVLSNYNGTKQQLCFLSRARSATGWTLTPVLANGKAITAKVGLSPWSIRQTGGWLLCRCRYAQAAAHLSAG